MEFPITRHQLQTYNVLEALRKKKIDEHVNRICGFVQITVTRGKEQRYKYDGIFHIKNPYVKEIGRHVPSILPDVLAKLKELFIDCEVLVDPLETYILIDWS